MPDAINARTHFVEMPPGTPTGFPVAQVFREEGSELDTPFAQGFMTLLNTALVEQFLNVSVTQQKAVIEPDSVLNDGHREAVAVRLGVGHGGSAYPNPVKATQPSGELNCTLCFFTAMFLAECSVPSFRQDFERPRTSCSKDHEHPSLHTRSQSMVCRG